MLLVLFYVFLAYLAYRLIFNFILPIYRATRQVRRGFRNMQDQMAGGRSADPQDARTASKPAQKPVGDYIDFEEVKEP